MPWVKERSARNGWALQFLRCASEPFPRGLFPGRGLRRFRGTGSSPAEFRKSRRLHKGPSLGYCLTALQSAPRPNAFCLWPAGRACPFFPLVSWTKSHGAGEPSAPWPVRPVCSVRPVRFRPASASPGRRRPSFKKKTRSFHPLSYYGGSASPVQDKRRDWR